jgi:hypothetical protein
MENPRAPARDARPFSSTNQPDPAAKSAGWDVAREIRERIAARKNELLEAQFTRALSIEHPQGHQAAADLMNRIMPPKTEIEANVSSHVIRAPAKPADAAEWAATYAPKEATE